MSNKFKTIYLSLICLLLFVLPLFAQAQDFFGELTEEEKKATPITSTIRNIYWFGVGIVGFAAVVVLVIAGIMYMQSYGDPQKITQAKQLIGGALIGVVILLFSYTILRTVNPALVRLREPFMEVKVCGGEGDSCDAENPCCSGLTCVGGICERLPAIPEAEITIWKGSKQLKPEYPAPAKIEDLPKDTIMYDNAFDFNWKVKFCLDTRVPGISDFSSKCDTAGMCRGKLSSNHMCLATSCAECGEAYQDSYWQSIESDGTSGDLKCYKFKRAGIGQYIDFRKGMTGKPTASCVRHEIFTFKVKRLDTDEYLNSLRGEMKVILIP